MEIGENIARQTSGKYYTIRSIDFINPNHKKENKEQEKKSGESIISHIKDNLKNHKFTKKDSGCQ